MGNVKAFGGLLLVFVVDYLQWSAATRCGINQITVVQNHSSELCLECPVCPEGTGSVPHCGSFITSNVTVTCKPCVQHVSYSKSHDHTSCRPCRMCVENEEVIKNCTTTSDAECGECKPGFYRSFVYSCEKCSPCCQDTLEHDVEPQCLNQGFPRDRACRYTGRECGETTVLNPTVLNPTVLNPTVLNIESKATATQEKRMKYPLPYIIGGIVFIFVVLILAMVATVLMCRIYFGVKGDRPRVQLQLHEQYDENVNLSSQMELGKSLVVHSRV